MDKQTQIATDAALHQRMVIATLIAMHAKHANLLFQHGNVVRVWGTSTTHPQIREQLDKLEQEIDDLCDEMQGMARNLALQTIADREVLLIAGSLEPISSGEDYADPKST
jgi:tetrahydromethanopterin S-methyltransferase subunit B